MLSIKNTFLVLLSIVALKASSGDSLYLTINFAGDVTLANHFERHVGKKYEYPFKVFPEFSAADLTVVNLENPLTTRGIPSEKMFNFRARPDYVHVLKNGGIDIVNLANNHIYDYQEQGLFDTLEHLDAANILYVGAGRNLELARKPIVLEEQGIKLAFLGYYGLKKHSDSHPATTDSAGTALRRLELIKQDIQALRDSIDIIIVNFHWGIEKEHIPEVEQIEFAHETIDFGADLVIGHHPHVLQGIERYQNKFIVYSLGNFIFGGNSRKHEKTAVFQAQININAKEIETFSIIPVEVNYWQPKQMYGNAGNAVIDSLKKYSTVFDNSAFEK